MQYKYVPWQVEDYSHEDEVDGNPLVVRVVDWAVNVKLVATKVARAGTPVVVRDPEVGIHPTI